MKTAAIYVRVSTANQHVESQLYDLRELAAKHGFKVAKEYQDCGVSGRRSRRPGLDSLIADALQKKFSVVLVAAFDRVARSVKHFLQVMDEFDILGVTFISRRENVDTSGPMGGLFLTLIGSIAELESDLIRERVLAGMRRAKLDGVRIGRAPMNIDRAAVVRDRFNFCRRPFIGEKRKLAVDCIWLCAFAASGVVSVVSQVMRFPFVSQLKVKNILQTTHQLRITDGKEDLDTMTQVSPHEVGTAEINFLLLFSVPKVIDAAMLQEPPHNARDERPRCRFEKW